MPWMNVGATNAQPSPALSVILVVAGLRRRGARTLKTILDQKSDAAIEVVLLDCGSLAHPPLPGSEDPRVRSFRVGPEKLFAECRWEGVKAARAPAVAFVEEHCLTKPGWAQALIAAHAGPWVGIGCAFENGNPEIGGTAIISRNNYGEYLPSRSPGPTTWISGHNSSYKRQALLDFGDELRLLLTCDVVMNRALVAKGQQLYFEPRAQMAHLNEDSMLAFAWGIFAWNWGYSAVRWHFFHWSALWRAIYALGLPLMPWYRSAKILLRGARHGPRVFLQALIDTPVTFFLNSSSALGQVAGLFLPHHDIEKSFSFYEMHTSRPSVRDFDPL
jgi:hypothetical protein